MSAPNPVLPNRARLSLKDLLARLLDDDPAVRQAALADLDRASFRMQWRAVEALIRRAIRPSFPARAHAVAALRVMAWLAVQRIRSGLITANTARQRARQAELLGEVAPKGDRAAITALYEVFEDEDEHPEVERAAQAAIERIDPTGRVQPYDD